MRVFRQIVLFSLTVALFTVVHPAQAVFTDVPTNHENYEAIEYVQEKGIMTGYDDGSFKPDKKINRAEFITAIVKARYPGRWWGYNCFIDVTWQWYSSYICFAQRLGIVDGYNDGTFQPDRIVSFAEAAKMLVKIYGYQIADQTIWYQSYIEKLSELNAVPLSITSFFQHTNRAETAEMIYRLDNNITDKSSQSYVSILDSIFNYSSADDGEIDELFQIRDLDNWFNYSSSAFDFSLNLPQEVELLTCEEDIEIADAKVFEDAETFYLAPEYIYTELNGNSCSQVNVDLSTLQNEDILSWQIHPYTIDTLEALDSLIKNRFEEGCYLAALKANEQTGSYDVITNYTSPFDSDQERCFSDVSEIFKYYPAYNRASELSIIETYIYFNIEKVGYDEMIRSFRFE